MTFSSNKYIKIYIKTLNMHMLILLINPLFNLLQYLIAMKKA